MRLLALAVLLVPIALLGPPPPPGTRRTCRRTPSAPASAPATTCSRSGVVLQTPDGDMDLRTHHVTGTKPPAGRRDAS
jgi:hypothetical protein